MIKDEKIAALATAMTATTRDNGEVFNHFTKESPQELQDLYLKHYGSDDLDFEIFNRALDVVDNARVDAKKDDNGKVDEENVVDNIYTYASDSASIMTYDRLQYLNNNNEQEISEMMRDFEMRSIADACAAWYDKQVEQAAIIINDWVMA